jgi:hypothetical protein
VDTFQVPSIPTPRSDDPEDVSWALSTAEAMWSRGDHAEAIKWIRRGAEAASEAEADDRALELAKAAADLAGLIVRMSQADTSADAGAKGPPASAAPPPSVAPVPVTTRSVPPPAAPRASGAPPAPSKAVSVVPPGGSPAAASVAAPRPSQMPRPLAAQRGPDRVQSTGRGVLSPSPKIETKKKSKSEVRLEEEARAAAQKAERAAREEARRTHAEPAPQTRNDPHDAHEDDDPAADTDQHNAKTSEHAAVIMADLEATRVTQQKKKANKRNSRTNEMRPRAGSATDEWDAHPTQSLSRAELESITNEHPPAPPSHPGTTPKSAAPPPAQPSRRAPVAQDPSGPILASQAVRVVLWQDVEGVHVAPAGTVVSAITVDAILVALDPAADLSAWLDPRRNK